MTQLQKQSPLNTLAVQPILIIGSGRLSQHLQHWLKQLNINIQFNVWSRQSSVEVLQELIKISNSVWLAISDKSIGSFYDEHESILKNKKVIHFSGSYFHSKISCVHPLMTFSHDLYDLDFYQQIHLTTFDQDRLSDLIPFLSNPTFSVPSSDKKLYHALCVASGNIPQMLWQKTLEHSNQLNIPQVAFELFWQQSLKNLIKQPNTAVTGPIARQDQQTILENIESLKQSSFLKKMYQCAAEFYKETK